MKEQQGFLPRVQLEVSEEDNVQFATADTPNSRCFTYVPEALLSEAVREAEEKGFNRGLMHKSVPRGMVSVHGTDGCFNCETGRITLYAASRYCTECEHEAASTEGGKGGE